MTSVIVPVKINYQGDPGIFALNAQRGNTGVSGSVKAQTKILLSGTNQYEAVYNPLVITNASLQAHDPNYRGHCPKDLNFVVRYRGTGKGMVRYHIVENGATVHMSAPCLTTTNLAGASISSALKCRRTSSSTTKR